MKLEDKIIADKINKGCKIWTLSSSNRTTIYDNFLFE